MKAIVAEIDKKQMIVITDKGDFVKVKRQMSVGIGDEIELKSQKTYLKYKRLASVAACFLACIFLSTGVYAYYTPYSYVSVDINPSIALSLNRFEKVISVNPLSEDAAGFIKDTKNLKNQDIDEAITEIIKSASEKGYIDEKAENQVMVVVSAKNPKQEEKLANAVVSAADNELSKVNSNYGVTVEKTSVENYKAALSNKVSPGREILAKKLKEINPELKDEEVRNMSVKEVVSLIKEGRKAIKEAEKDNKDKEKDASKEEHFGNSRDKDKEDANEAAKDEPKEKKGGKDKGEVKPSAATSKDNNSKPAAANKDAKSKNESNGKGNTEEDDKDNKGNKNIDKDDEDKDDEDKDDEDKENGDQEDKGNPEDNSKKEDKSDKDSDREKGHDDKDKGNGKKND